MHIYEMELGHWLAFDIQVSDDWRLEPLSAILSASYGTDAEETARL